MFSYRILVGAYGTALTTLVFTDGGNTSSSLAFASTTRTTAKDPSWLATNPRNSSIVYASFESSSQISSFLRDGQDPKTSWLKFF